MSNWAAGMVESKERKERMQKVGKRTEQPYTANPGNTAQCCNATSGMLRTLGIYQEGNGGNAVARPGRGWVCAGDWSVHISAE